MESSDVKIVLFENPEEMQNSEGGEAEREKIAASCRENFENCLQNLRESGALDGVTIHSEQKVMGTLCVSGSPEKLQALGEYLRTKALGILIDNFEFKTAR